MSLDSDYQLLKVFDELYVGLKAQGDENPLLGFATPKENNKAFEKRKYTVDHWAKPGWKQVQNADGSWDRDKNPQIEPRIIQNEAVSGFRIADDVRRTYWGGGNVVWRVYDPRGFELEISSANLIRIIDSVGINAGGEIPVKCKWGRLGANNILVPEGSELWNKCIKDAATLKARSKTVSAYKAGDVVVLKNGMKCVYVGRMNVLMINRQTHYDSEINNVYWHQYKRISLLSVSLEVSDKYDVVIIFNPDGSLGTVVFYAKIHVIQVDEKYEDNVNLIDYINSSSTQKKLASNLYGYSTILAASFNPITPKLEYRPIQSPVELTNNKHHVIKIKSDTWHAPYIFYKTADGTIRVVNDSTIHPRSYLNGYKDSSISNLVMESNVLTSYDDEAFHIHYPNKPAQRSYYSHDLYEGLIKNINAASSTIFPHAFEVGVTVDGKWVPVIS